MMTIFVSRNRCCHKGFTKKNEFIFFYGIRTEWPPIVKMQKPVRENDDQPRNMPIGILDSLTAANMRDGAGFSAHSGEAMSPGADDVSVQNEAAEP